MTVEDVERRLEGIRRASDDYEAAHAREDRLFIAVLRAIAEGTCVDSEDRLAAAALKSLEIDFPRYTA